MTDDAVDRLERAIQPHHCHPGSELRDGTLNSIYAYPGDRWFCRCGLVYVAIEPPLVSAGLQSCSAVWRPETRRERRKRERAAT